VVLAARGTRRINAPEEPVEDGQTTQRLRRQARNVYVKATLVAVGLSILVALVPA
jgi:hypothetical protein